MLTIPYFLSCSQRVARDDSTLPRPYDYSADPSGLLFHAAGAASILHRSTNERPWNPISPKDLATPSHCGIGGIIYRLTHSFAG
jgi:hypothetical protein